MPKNICGKKYDLRPYFDEYDYLVIKRNLNIGRFKMKEGKLISKFSGYYHIDEYDKSMMMKQARAILNKLDK